MIFEALYLVFSILALSFLIFIHELGHYWVAKREGFDIEVFSIGFGKPIFQWKWQGVKWQVCYLIFGGYVKIKGMYPQEDEQPSTFQGSFYNKHPWQRIKVAIAGPLANFLLAFIIFSFIWQFGGLEKSFYEFSPYLGSIAQESELYKEGIRPGDKILSYDDYRLRKSEDHLYGAMLASENGVLVKGEKWLQGNYLPFEKYFKPYEDPRLKGTTAEGIKTLGIQSPAMMLIYDRYPHAKVEPILEGSPLKEAGIEYQDRLVWLDGEYLFSSIQLSRLLNDQHALLSVLRLGELTHVRVPKFALGDFSLSQEQKDEFEDLAFEGGKPFSSSFFIPYEVDQEGLVLGSLVSPLASDKTLKKGDRILAVDGKKTLGLDEIFGHLQHKELLAIVQGGVSASERLSYRETEGAMGRESYGLEVEKLLSYIGSDKTLPTQGAVRFLKPFKPKKRKDYPTIYQQVLQEANGQQLLASQPYQKNILGVYFQDKKVNYNPSPLEASKGVLTQIFRTLSSLFSGDLSPKWMGGPVGMVQYMQVTLSHWGLDDALYWMAIISLNLGILNLLPIPVLDGGYIVISIVEWIMGRSLPIKVLEYILMPFMALILFMFVYTTFNDLIRLFF